MLIQYEVFSSQPDFVLELNPWNKAVFMFLSPFVLAWSNTWSSSLMAFLSEQQHHRFKGIQKSFRRNYFVLSGNGRYQFCMYV